MQGSSVFLVEDEALIRMMIAEMLDELGHRVVAEAGSIAVAEPLARTAMFDLGILDINVGGFNISPIAEIIDGRGLPFLFVSGYGSGGKPVLFRSKPVLRKPFLISDLENMINSALSDRSTLGPLVSFPTLSPRPDPMVPVRGPMSQLGQCCRKRA
jgi:DNA-binding response OmpR family regulator